MLAGLAGSPHLVSATIVALTRLVHEFHGEQEIVELVLLHTQIHDHEHMYVPMYAHV